MEVNMFIFYVLLGFALGQFLVGVHNPTATVKLYKRES
jgi:hypothetical protein